MVRTEEIMKTIPEGSSATFRCNFKDELGTLIAPVSLYWDITALDGTVIAFNQVVSVLAIPTNITIPGTTMRILDGEDSYGERLITFRGTYNSTYGNGLVINKQMKFRVQNLKLIAYPIDISVIDAIFTDDYVQQVA